MPRTAAGEPILLISQVVRDFPILVAMAIAGTLLLREIGRQRWRRSLNRALHELRRPLQVMALQPESAAIGPGTLDLATRALADLDAEINGAGRASDERQAEPAARADCRELVAMSRERWLAPFAERGRELSVRCDATGHAAIEPTDLARAVDNLIANALEHGSGAVSVTTVRVPEGPIRIAVTDGGPKAQRATARDRRRHGHGLAIVREVVHAAGGEIDLTVAEGESTATIEIPAHEGSNT